MTKIDQLVYEPPSYSVLRSIDAVELQVLGETSCMPKSEQVRKHEGHAIWIEFGDSPP